MDVQVNYIAILLASVVSMAVGFLWYSPVMFAKSWMKLMGYTAESMEKAKKSMGKMYTLSFVASLVTAYVLAHVMVLSENYFHYSSLVTGLSSAFWMWLGFVAPVQMTDVLFGGKKWDLFVINTGYQLVALLGMGVTLGLLR
jgi:hypothetical protein